jgi:hypothetical protein
MAGGERNINGLFFSCHDFNSNRVMILGASKEEGTPTDINGLF